MQRIHHVLESLQLSLLIGDEEAPCPRQLDCNLVASLFPVAMPGAPSSFLLLTPH